MATIKEEVQQRVKNAMLEKDANLLAVLRGMLAKFTEKEKSGVQLIEQDYVDVLIKMAKQRKESILAFADRADLRVVEEYQLSVIEPYLPKQVDKQEVESFIANLVSTGVTNKGAIMGALSKQYGKTVDMKQAGEYANIVLSS